MTWQRILDAAHSPQAIANADDDRLPGRIISQQGPVRFVVTPEGLLECRPSGSLSYLIELGSSPAPAVGDYVTVSASGGRIETVLPRFSVFERKEAGDRAVAQVLCANVDAVLLVTTGPAERDYSIRRLERFLATLDPSVKAIIVLNKSDLESDAESVARATRAEIPNAMVVPLSAAHGTGVDRLCDLLPERGTIAVAGSSGSGKSTLIARLTGEQLQTGDIRENDGRGRHTTTGRSMYPLGDHAILVDTPGVREVQLWAGESPDAQLANAFPEIAAAASGCKFSDCSHHHEPECAVLEAVQSGEIPHSRYLSYLELHEELKGNAAREGARSQKQERLLSRRVARKARVKRRSRGG
ncbi:MAG: ribosome small subunit-dependent GTPase A [Spirochaetota bacterium]